MIGMTMPHLDGEAPRHLLGIGEPDDLVEGIGLGVDLFDCAVPTRLARHGMALAPLPEKRFRFDIRRAEFATDEGALVEGCPCAACVAHSRAYIHFLSRAEELTGVRLLVLHNLTYLEHARAGRPGGDSGGSIRRLQAGRAQRGIAVERRRGAGAERLLAALTVCSS